MFDGGGCVVEHQRWAAPRGHVLGGLPPAFRVGNSVTLPAFSGGSFATFSAKDLLAVDFGLSFPLLIGIGASGWAVVSRSRPPRPG